MQQPSVGLKSTQNVKKEIDQENHKEKKQIRHILNFLVKQIPNSWDMV